MNCNIGKTIRTLRLQHNLTQEQLADQLGVSYQSVSRWENSVTYPDIELLPALARCFSVSVDALLGQEDAEKNRQMFKTIHDIATATEKDRDRLIELIRVCRRESDRNTYFEALCDTLRYSPLCKDPDVLSELRKTANLFFDTCTDPALRANALRHYACLEEESHIGPLLDCYASDQTVAKDYLLKERYLFRDDFSRFDMVRQRWFHKQIAYLIDGDISLWRDSSKPMDIAHTLFENHTKLAFLHALCQETPTESHPITCGKAPDVFAEQRLFIGLRQACAYTADGETEKAYAVLEDIVCLMEAIAAMPDGTELRCTSPALNTLTVTIKEEQGGRLGRVKTLYYTTESGQQERCDEIVPKIILECLESADYARFGWLDTIRSEKRFKELIARLKTLL